MLKVRPKEFIHLNLVSNAAQEEEEEEVKSQCPLLQLHGDIAAIKKKRRPIEMEDIGISEDQSVAQHKIFRRYQCSPLLGWIGNS